METSEKQGQEASYSVVCDIGGTNFRVRVSRIIFNESEAKRGIIGFKKIQEIYHSTAKLVSFSQYIDQTLEAANVQPHRVLKIVMAVRGYQQGKCFTEFKDESEDRLREHYGGIPEVIFMNDVVGMAQSLIHGDDSSYIQLKHDKTVEIKYIAPQVKILFTMGTGTGVSLLLPYPKSSKSDIQEQNGKLNYDYMIVSSEAWGSYLSADQSDEMQTKAAEYLFRKMKTRSSLLKFCKGPAILNLYQFMKEQYPDEGNEKLLKQTKKKLKSEKKGTVVSQQECITYLAVNGEDQLCQRTISFLVEIIGCFLQKLGVIGLPMGGIYIGGGVSNYISSYIEKNQDLFWKHFLNNPMREPVLEKIPVFLMRENPTLDGLEAKILREQTL